MRLLKVQFVVADPLRCSLSSYFIGRITYCAYLTEFNSNCLEEEFFPFSAKLGFFGSLLYSLFVPAVFCGDLFGAAFGPANSIPHLLSCRSQLQIRPFVTLLMSISEFISRGR